MYSASEPVDDRCDTCGSYLPPVGMARQTVAESSGKPAGTVNEPAPPSAPPKRREPTPEDLIRPRHLSPEYARHITAAWEATFSQFKYPKDTLNSSSSAVESAADLLIGSRSVVNVSDEKRGDYELTDVIGEGNMGVVWSARQAALDREVALKIPKPTASKSELGRNQFISEVLVTGQLDHPNIVPIYDLARDEKGQLFYSMKRVEGRPWNECMHEPGVTTQVNVEILMKVCDAVRFAHDRGVIHRDIKPHNIMIGRYGEVSVMDWGIALRLDADAPDGGVTKLSPAGTPAYMAPEMATVSAGEIGPHTDVYLLGAVLYEVVSGEPPHPPPVDSEDYRELQRDALLIAARNEIKRTDRSGELVDIAYKAMATDISGRFQTVAEFQTAIREYFSHAESIKLAERGQEYLASAKSLQNGVYEDFAKSRFAFAEALELWPENTKARAGLAEATIAYAETALQRQDYALGISLLEKNDLNQRKLLGKLTSEKRKQDRNRFVVRGSMLIAAVSMVLGTAISLYYLNDARRERDAKEQQRARAADLAIEAQQERDAKELERARAADLAIEAQQERDAKELERARAAKLAIEAQQERDAKERQRIRAEQASYQSEIGLAAEELQRNAFVRANEILKQQADDEVKNSLRGWEWQYLSYLANEQPIEEFGLPDGRPMPQRFESAAVSSLGDRIAVGTSDGKVFVWTREKPDRPDELKYGASVTSVDISPDGNLLAAGGTEQRTGSRNKHHVKIWNLATPNQEPTTLAEHEARILSVAFSPDGRSLLTGAADGAAHLWNLDTGKQLRGFYGHGQLGGDVWSARFSPGDGRWAITSGEDGTVRVWNADQGGEVQRIGGFREPVRTSVFSPDGKFIISGTRDGRLFASVFEPKESSESRESRNAVRKQEVAGQRQSDSQRDLIPLGQHTAAITEISFSPDGSHIFSASHDNTVRVWDISQGVPRATLDRTLRGHGGWVRGCVATSDDRVLSTGYDGRVLLWDWKTYQFPRVLRAEQAHQLRDTPLTSAAVSRDGRWIATGSSSGDVIVWNLDNPLDPRPEILREGHEWQPTTAVFFNNGDRLLTAGGDNTTLVWDAHRGNQLLRMGGWYERSDERIGSGWRGVAAVASNGRLIATGSDAQNTEDAIARIWDAQTGAVLHQLYSPKIRASSDDQEWPEATALVFAPGDASLIVGDQTGKCYSFDTRTGTIQASFTAHGGKVVAARFLPDDRHVLTSGADGRVVKWDMRSTPPRVADEFRHDGSIIAMDVSRDGNHIVVAHGINDKSAKLTRFDLSRQQTSSTIALSRVLDSAAIVRSVAFDGEGKRALVTIHFPDRDNRPFEMGVWDWNGTDEPYRRLADNFSDLSMALYAPNRKDAILTVGGRGARIKFANRTLMKFQSQTGINSVSFSSDDRSLATAGTDGSVKIWQLDDRGRSWRPIQTLLVKGQASVNSVTFAPSRNDMLLLALDNGVTECWQTDDGEWKLARRFGSESGPEAAVHQAIFSPDGARILTLADGAVTLWNMRTGSMVVNPKMGGTCAAFSSDGKWVCVGSGDEASILIADTLDQLDLTFKGHSLDVRSVAFTNDGSRLFTASDDSTVKVWDTSMLAGDDSPSGAAEIRDNVRELLTLEEHTKEVTSVTFSSHEKQTFLITTGLDGQCILWPSM
jgi:hypothetical protein